MGRQELADAAEERLVTGGRAGREELGQRRLIRPRLNQPALEDGLDLGGEDEAVADAGVVKRLHAEAIAREEEAAAGRVPDREGEHAAQPLDAGIAPLLVGVDDRLGVGARAIAMPGALELAPQIGVVVDLAVEDDADGFVLVGQRLAAAGEVDDAESPVAERGHRVGEQAGAVGPAVGDHVPHADDARRVVSAQRVAADDSRDSTHATRSP